MEINNSMTQLNVFVFKSAQEDKETFLDTLSSKFRLKKFFDFYFQERNFGRIKILDSRFLRNKGSYCFTNGCFNIETLEQASLLKKELHKSCFSDGHMSVFFQLESEVLVDFMKSERFFILFKKESFNSQNLGFLKNEYDEKQLMLNLNDILLDKEKALVTFTHDALDLYVFSFLSGEEFHKLERNEGAKYQKEFEEFQNTHKPLDE